MSSEGDSQPKWMRHLAGVNQANFQLIREALEESGEMARLHFGLSVETAREFETFTIDQARRFGEVSAPAGIWQIKDSVALHEMIASVKENAPPSDGLIAAMGHAITKAR